MRSASVCSFLACLAAGSPAAAQTAALALRWSTGERNPAQAIVGLNSDDDDDDGVPDLQNSPILTADRDDDITRITALNPAAGALRVTATGPLRIVTARGLESSATLPVVNGECVIELMGVEASRAAGDASLTVSSGGAEARVAVTVVGASVLHGDNRPVRAHRDAVGLSHEITNNDTLPRSARWSEASPDPDNTRVEIWDPSLIRGAVRVESLGTRASIGVARDGVRGSLTEVALLAPRAGVAMRSQFVRLVGDDMDLRAPGVSGQTLRVGLRDRLRVKYRRDGAAGEASTDVRVGRPGNEDGPLAARRAAWHILVLRDRNEAQGGTPLMGDSNARAEQIARNQIAISNEIYLQCAITWGDPAQGVVEVRDPPPSALLSVSDNEGFRAAGGEVRLRAGGRAIGPVRTVRGWRPVETAMAIARALRAQGLNARVTLNERTDYGSEGSADVVVRDGRGALVALSAPSDGPISTDGLQTVRLGSVDFTDGIEEFNNLNSSSGTLEERTLTKTLMDDDPSTIDLFMINRFTRGTRIGEAFVEGDSGAIVNALLLDRAGTSAEREAWTQSHEAGHIMLNQPWHPDNLGPDRPWLLMDADASLAAVAGPKRLTAEECRHITQVSGVGSSPGLLRPYDPAVPSPRAREFLGWPREALWPDAAGEAPAVAPTTATIERPQDPTALSLGVTIL